MPYTFQIGEPVVVIFRDTDEMSEPGVEHELVGHVIGMRAEPSDDVELGATRVIVSVGELRIDAPLDCVEPC